LTVKFKIIKILSASGKKAQVVLDPCPFHPSGGGQPGDTGKLSGNGFRADVRDTRKLKDGEQGESTTKESAVLDLVVTEGKPLPDMDVSAEVNLARNAVLSRMHTGQHIFSRLQENASAGLETVKINIGETESVVYVRYGGVLTWESLFDIEEKTIQAIRADVPVEALVLPRAEAEKLPELKAHWDRIHDEEIRVVRIAGVDATACSGTHSASTKDVGGFMVTGFNGSPPDWEVRFTVRQEELSREHSRVMRKLQREIGCNADQLAGVIARQKEENDVLRHVLDKVRGYISFPWEIYGDNEKNFPPLHTSVVSGLTKELLSAPARNRATENPDAFCLVIAPGTAPKEPFPFVLLRGANLSADLSELTKNAEKFPELEARGGGKPDWLNGMTTQRDPAVWLDCLKRISGA